MLENLLFPKITKTPEDIFALYPRRTTTGEVTRIAPSPTGFFHLGTLYTTMLDDIIAKQTGGVVYLRSEDTDQKREVEGAINVYNTILNTFGISFDEGSIGPNGTDIGAYGPYTQSQREEIYLVFLKDLLKRKLAYPCFMTEEELEETRRIQEASKVPTGIYGEFSFWRDASEAQVQQALDAGKPFVIRFRSKGNILGKIHLHDTIKGDVVMGENYQDIVILKTQGLPTYHFAHITDDYLMGTTLVIRGDEWFASLPLHLEMFATMGWSAPKYAHISPLVKLDGGSKRKLSKRKDTEANVLYYLEAGFLVEGVIDYLCNLMNAGFEDWRKMHLDEDYRAYPFSLQKMSSSGALVDLDKLKWVNATTIKHLSLELLSQKIFAYLELYDPAYAQVMKDADTLYVQKVIKELQNRLVLLSEWKSLTTFFFADFEVNESIATLLLNPKMKIEDLEMAKKGLEIGLSLLTSMERDFQSVDEAKEAFIQAITQAGMKNGQVLWPVRVALSGEEFSPGALELCYILGNQKSRERLKNVLQFFS